MEGGWFLWVALLGLLPLVVGTIIGANKGRGGAAFLLCLFFSWIGFIITLLLSDEKKKEREHMEMISAVKGGGASGQSVKVRCPNCKALVDENAKFCPECAAPLE